MGTQVHALELIRGLARSNGVRLRVLLPDEPGREALEIVERLCVEQITMADRGAWGRPTDIVHRPYQVFQGEDLEVLPLLGERLIVTQQDLIAYHNPGYFERLAQWHEHRALTELALAIADRVVFFSDHSRRAALDEALVDDAVTSVVYLGTDHGLLERRRPDPEPVPSVAGREFLLCLGTDFRHKNRVFALRLLDALERRHGWAGALVLAGPSVAHGSSRGDEAAFLATRPGLADAVVDLGSVSEAQKRWLLERSTAVVYPTLYEGFGLIPFEAASAGSPCIYASVTSLAEILPAAGATIVPWDADATADRVVPLLVDEDERGAAVEAIRTAGARLTWDAATSNLLEAYERALASRPRPGRNVLVERWAASRRQAPAPRNGALETMLPEDARSFLTAVALRRWLRVPLFGAFALAFRAGHLARRGLGRTSRRPRGAPDPGSRSSAT
jgi:glycosyltransferase involved in cell wall biosynthesis